MRLRVEKKGKAADLVGNLENLCLLTGLGLFKSGLQAREHVPWKRCGGSDDDGEFSPVLFYELVEAFYDALCLSEPAIL